MSQGPLDVMSGVKALPWSALTTSLAPLQDLINLPDVQEIMLVRTDAIGQIASSSINGMKTTPTNHSLIISLDGCNELQSYAWSESGIATDILLLLFPLSSYEFIQLPKAVWADFLSRHKNLSANDQSKIFQTELMFHLQRLVLNGLAVMLTGMPVERGLTTFSVDVNDATCLPLAPTGAQFLPKQKVSDYLALVDHIRPGTSPETVALKGGLILWQGLLHQSHEYSQTIEGDGQFRHGDYWHAIMHRMEPDDMNAKYWFRRVGTHPVSNLMTKLVTAIIEAPETPDVVRSAFTKLIFKKQVYKGPDSTGSWDAFEFVDLCSQLRKQETEPLLTWTLKLQQWEMLLLIAHNFSSL